MTVFLNEMEKMPDDQLIAISSGILPFYMRSARNTMSEEEIRNEAKWILCNRQKKEKSPLNEIIKADVEEVTQSLLKDTVEPWIFFRSHGVHIKKVGGSSISISGVDYSGRTITVFW